MKFHQKCDDSLSPLHKDALSIMSDAFMKIRFLSLRSPTPESQQMTHDLSDVLHNLPDMVSGRREWDDEYVRKQIIVCKTLFHAQEIPSTSPKLRRSVLIVASYALLVGMLLMATLFISMLALSADGSSRVWWAAGFGTATVFVYFRLDVHYKSLLLDRLKASDIDCIMIGDNRLEKIEMIPEQLK